jgi:hypothetical protein
MKRDPGSGYLHYVTDLIYNCFALSKSVLLSPSKMPRVAHQPTKTNAHNPLLTSGPNIHPNVLKRNQVRSFYMNSITGLTGNNLQACHQVSA